MRFEGESAEIHPYETPKSPFYFSFAVPRVLRLVPRAIYRPKLIRSARDASPTWVT